MEYTAVLSYNNIEVNLMDPVVVYARYRNKASITCKTVIRPQALYAAVSLNQPQCYEEWKKDHGNSGAQMAMQLAAIDESLAPIVQYSFIGNSDMPIQHKCQIASSEEVHVANFQLVISTSHDHAHPMVSVVSAPFRLLSKIPRG